MEGSYEKDQKTIVGLDFFDELTNLQTAADLNKRSVSQMQCAAPPRLWKAGWSSVCARDCRGRQHTLLAFLPSASLAFLKVLVLLSWNLLVKLRVQGSFVSCSTSFESESGNGQRSPPQQYLCALALQNLFYQILVSQIRDDTCGHFTALFCPFY